VSTAAQEAWLPVILGGVVLLLYELHFRYSWQRAPLRFARATHARLRADWVRSLMQQPGNELLAVQTIRNSLLSATLTASTAVLALIGAISLLGESMAPELLRRTLRSAPALTPRMLLMAALIAILSASFAFSAMAVRFFNHAGYLMTSLQQENETRDRLQAMAGNYMMRAGNYHSLGLRTLFWIAPVAVGLVNPLLMPPASVALVGVLLWFDRTPEQLEGVLPGDAGR
jgi:uncharacterized membrane protein